MVTKSKKQRVTKRGKATVSDLTLNKETVKDLTDREAEKIRGGTIKGVTVVCRFIVPKK